MAKGPTLRDILDTHLHNLVEVVDTVDDVDGLIAEIIHKIEHDVNIQQAKPYRLLACYDLRQHLKETDETGRCIKCGFGVYDY